MLKLLRHCFTSVTVDISIAAHSCHLEEGMKVIPVLLQEGDGQIKLVKRCHEA